MPMGASCSYATYEKFSTFLEWCVIHETTVQTLNHYLDDFIFYSKKGSSDCQMLFDRFHELCDMFCIPYSPEKLLNQESQKWNF